MKPWMIGLGVWTAVLVSFAMAQEAEVPPVPADETSAIETLTLTGTIKKVEKDTIAIFTLKTATESILLPPVPAGVDLEALVGKNVTVSAKGATFKLGDKIMTTITEVLAVTAIEAPPAVKPPAEPALEPVVEPPIDPSAAPVMED